METVSDQKIEIKIGRTLTRESNSEHTASLKTSNIPFAWFLKE